MMHTSLLETQRINDDASFSKLTRRARRMASTTKKQSKIKDEFVERDFKKLTYRARQMAKKAIPSEYMIQQSAPAHCNGQAVARCADNEPNFCLGDTAPKTSKSAEYVWPEHYGVTSPNVDSQIALPAMISPGQAGIQSSMPGQTLEWSSQPLSSLVLSAFAMGAAWATRPRLT